MSAASREYVLTKVGRLRWRIDHHTPFERVASRTYFVSVRPDFSRATCSCPSYRFGGGPCKHVRFMATLLGRPSLTEPIPALDPSF